MPVRWAAGFAIVALFVPGCADTPVSELSAEEALLQGMGIVQGLLVDDRFRPIELVEEGNAGTEHQAEGFVLLVETGDQMRADQDGVFTSPPLAPGTYTLRATIAGHETVPQTVQVRAGQTAEVTVVARRVANLDDLVVSWDLAVFIPCNVTLLVQPLQGDCFGDQSGDSDRYYMELDMTGFPDASFVLTELYLNKEAGDVRHGTYQVQITGASLDGVTTNNYAVKGMDDGRYDRVLLERGVESEWQDEPLLSYSTWEDMGLFTWFVSGQGLLRPELQSAGSPFGQGAGPQVGLKAQMLVTMFYTAERAEAEAFCGLCA